MTKKIIPATKNVRKGYQIRENIKEHIKSRFESVKQGLLEMPAKGKPATQKKIKDMKKALNKWEETHVTIISELFYKMVMLRHMIKMAWFDANCEDKPIPGVTNLEELTEEQ